MARADDYLIVRGAYYREASTRVIQPMIELASATRRSGIDVGAHFLVDAITSASIAAGTPSTTSSPRSATRPGFRVRKRWERSDLARATSTAPNRTTGRTASARRTARASGTTRRRSAPRSGAASTPCRRRAGRRTAAPGMAAAFCTLNGWFGGLSYSQVLSPVAIAQISSETAYLEGFQGNLYRRSAAYRSTSSCPSAGCATRSRRASRTTSRGPRPACSCTTASTSTSTRAAPPTPCDPWLLTAHMVEARVYQQLTPTLEVRLLFRYYRQSPPTSGARRRQPTTLPPTSSARWRPIRPPATANANYCTADPKLGPVRTRVPGGEADLGRGRPPGPSRSFAGSPPAPSRSRTAATSRTTASATPTCSRPATRLPY